MAEPKIKMLKARRVPPEKVFKQLSPESVGGVKPEAQGLRLPERSIPIDDYDYKREQLHPTSDEPYAPGNTPLSEVPLDMLKSGVSGLVSTGEQALGQLGDLGDIRYLLASLINRKLGKYSGMDLGPGIEQAEKYSAHLPNTEDVAANVTDPLLEAMGSSAKDWGRYEPKSPWGSSASTAAGLLDPTEALLPAGKAFQTLKRAF